MTGLGVGLGRDPDALDPEAIGSEAAERALALVGARQPESRRCPACSTFVAASFVGFIGSMLSADAVQRGARCSPAARARRWPTPRSPSRTTAPSRAAWRARRSTARARRPGRRRSWRAGACSATCTTCAPPRRAGKATTGNAERSRLYRSPAVRSTNLVLEPGREDLAGLLRLAGHGLYVTDVAGLHSGVNPVSGTFSVGASGRLIEGGELGAPVREITIASDLPRCCERCER